VDSALLKVEAALGLGFGARPGSLLRLLCVVA